MMYVDVRKELLEWAGRHDDAVPPRSKMGKAITYLLNLWKGLTRFLDDPVIPLDNNVPAIRW